MVFFLLLSLALDNEIESEFIDFFQNLFSKKAGVQTFPEGIDRESNFRRALPR